jgi:hypothetical protein
MSSPEYTAEMLKPVQPIKLEVDENEKECPVNNRLIEI